jgi:PD-(D/E)XK nuclease superfamily
MKIDHWIDYNINAARSIRSAALETITQSEIMLRASCPRKWFYRYALKLKKRGIVDQNFIYGTIMHRLLEELYSSPLEAYAAPPEAIPLAMTDAMMEEITDDMVLSPAAFDEIDLTKRKVQIAFDSYRRHYYQKDAKLVIKYVERVIRLEWEGLQLAAKVDMIAKPKHQDGVFIWDYKTAGQLSAMALDAWTFRFQFLFYCWIYWKVYKFRPAGLMICGIKKSLLRPRKTKTGVENREEYLDRIRLDMINNREKFFFRQRIPLGTGALERFETEMLLPHVRAFNLMQEKGPLKKTSSAISALAMLQNTNQCHIYGSYCEYLPLCKDGFVAISEYDEQDAKHLELGT